MPDFELDAHESELLASFDAGELAPVADEAEFEELRSAARATGTRDRRLTVRLSSSELRAFKVLALREGIPHPTLVASVLHKYVTGRLVERA